MGRVLSSLAVMLVAFGATATHAAAYAAQPPTKGALYSDGQSGRYLLGGTWLYRADPASVGLAQQWQRSSSTTGWSAVTVPNAYNAGDFSTASMNGYVGWYRRDFTLPAGAFNRYVPASARRWIIRFESVNYSATVWLNGHRIGDHAGAYLPFEFALSGLHGGVNRLVVRVDDRRTPADLPPGPGGGWWNFGGLLREVYLRAVQRADLSQVQVRPLLPCPGCTATISEQALVHNVTGSAQRVHLQGSYGGRGINFGSATIAPHSTWRAHASTRVSHPRLWSLGHPSLYEATLSLTDGAGRRLEGYQTASGIRSIRVTRAGRITLNGRVLNLRGVNLHEQDLQLGAALDPAHLRQLMGWVRTIGAGIIRAHYPLNPELEEMADHYGILLWSEIPVYQVSGQYLGNRRWVRRAHALLQTNILTNQNHPSILLWSIGNELPTPAGPAQGAYIAGASALAHRLDPTRPVGMAIGDWPGVPCQGAYRPLQVIGFNDYFGWFDAGGGTTDDRDALSPFLDSLRACYPRKSIFVSEFGFDGNRNGPVEERGTYAFQSDATAFHLGVFATKPWLSGAMYFALQNYAAFPGYSGGNPRPNPPFNEKGLVDFQGNFKPAFAVASRVFHSTRQIGR